MFLPLIFASIIFDLVLVLLKKGKKSCSKKNCVEGIGKERREIRLLVCTSAEFSYQVVYPVCYLPLVQFLLGDSL